jgi:hypothetical protein
MRRRVRVQMIRAAVIGVGVIIVVALVVSILPLL